MNEREIMTRTSLLIKIRELVAEQELEEAAKLQKVLINSMENDKKYRLYRSTIDVDRKSKNSLRYLNNLRSG
jgi:hypothetical protein